MSICLCKRYFITISKPVIHSFILGGKSRTAREHDAEEDDDEDGSSIDEELPMTLNTNTEWRTRSKFSEGERADARGGLVELMRYHQVWLYGRSLPRFYTS